MTLCQGIKRQPRADRVFGAVFWQADSIFHDVVKLQEMFRRIFVVAKGDRFLIERHPLTQAIRIVHEVAHDAGVVRISGVSVGHGWIAFPAGSVHSVRLPGKVAHQEVIFGGKSQTLTIRHDSIHRDSFMPGVCLACKKVMDLDELVYGLEHVL